MRTNETNQKITNGQEEFIMKPYVDWCFKELMRNPKTRQGFIAVLLKVPPEEIGETILLKNELSRRSEEEKQGILDVHVLLRNGIQIDMEMQVAYVDYWDERQMFYLCKMFADQLKKGEGYEKLQKCIQVGILNFTYFHDDDISYHVINFRDNKTMKLYSDKMEIQILELPKIPEGYQDPDGIVAWMKFFRGPDKKEMEELAKENQYLEEAYEDLLEMSQDEEKRREYEARERAIRDYEHFKHAAERAAERALKEGHEKGMRQGIQEGIQQGIQQGIKQTLIDLYRKQVLTVEQAAGECGMTVEEFQKLL